MIDEEEEIEQEFSQWQNKLVKTYVINPRKRRGPLRTLSDGIRLAKPYERIKLVGGDYIETVSVDKPIELVAAEGEIPILSFRGTALTFSTNCPAYIHGIAIENKAKQKDTFAVVVSNGTPEFHDCRMSNIKICGVGEPKLVGCEIEESLSGSGLSIVDRAGGEYVDNTIRKHAEYCVYIDSSADSLVMKRNSIFQPIKFKSLGVVKITGITHGALCRPTLENNRIWMNEDETMSDAPLYEMRRASLTAAAAANVSTSVSISGSSNSFGESASFGSAYRPMRAEDMPGSMLSPSQVGVVVHIEASAQPSLINNDIKEGHIGVRCDSDSAPVLLQNRLIKNLIAGVHLIGDNGTVLEKNHIKDNLKAGVLITQSKKAKIIKNDFAANTSAIIVDDEGWKDTHRTADNALTIALNKFLTCTGPAIIVTGSALHVHISESYFAKNDATCVLVRDLSSAQITKNTFTENLSHCITVGAYGFGFYEENQMLENAGAGIVVEANGRPQSIYKNVIQFNRDHGIVFVGLGAKCDSVKQNTLTSNAKAQILVKDGADPTVFGNLVQDGRFDGIEITDGARGTYYGNTVTQNSGVGVKVGRRADPVLEHNTIESNVGAGVMCVDGALGTFFRNTITRSTQNNVVVTTQSNTVFRANLITHAGGIGAQLTEKSLSFWEKNEFESNITGGMVIEGASVPYVLRNKVRTSKGYGISSRGGAGVVCKNFVSGNTHGGLVSCEGGSTVFSNNTVQGEYGPGIHVRDAGSSTFTGNVVWGGFDTGLVVSGGGNSVRITQNTFSQNKAHGAQFHGIDSKKPLPGTMGLVEENTFTQNEKCGIVVQGNMAITITRNTINQNHVDGVALEGARSQVTNSSIMKMLENTITSNSRYGVHVVHSNSLQAHLELNKISEHGTNVYVENLRDVPTTEFAPPRFYKNDIHSAKSVNIEVGNYGTSIFKNNIISLAPIGVLVSDHGLGEFAQNELSEHRDVAVRVVGTGAFPRMSDNKITSSPLAIEVSDGGSGELTGNTVTCDVGATLRSGANPKLQKNKFLQCAEQGVRVEAGAEGQLVENTVSECRGGGILVDNANAGVTISKNKITQNAKYGIRVVQVVNPDVVSPTKSKKGASQQTLIEGNDITSNLFHGVVVGCAATPRIVRNNISMNSQCGVMFEAGALGFCGHNQIEKNKYHGAQLCAEAAPEIEHNYFHDGLSTGLHCDDNAGGTVMFNKFLQNTSCGVVMECGSKILFKENEVGPNYICGLKVVADTSIGTATHTIVGNKFYASDNGTAHCIEVCGSGSNPSVRQNSFDGGVTGAVVQEGGRGVFEENTFMNFTKHGLLLLDEDSNPSVSRNTFRCNTIGVLVTSSVCSPSSDMIFSNTFEDNATAGVSVECASTVHIAKNTFLNHPNACVMVSGRGTAGFVRNNIFRNAANFVGVEVFDHANPTISGNEFTLCAQYAVQVHRSGLGTIKENYFCNNGAAGVYIATFASPTVSRNVMCHHSEAAVLIEDAGQGVVEENDILNNQVGIRIKACGHVIVRRNTMHDNEVCGVHMLSGGEAQVEHNYLHGNGDGDVHMTDGATGSLMHNLFLSKVVCTTESSVKIEMNHFMSQKHMNSSVSPGQSLDGDGANTASPFHAAGVGIVIYERGNPKLHNNVLCGLALGASVYRGGRGTFDGNTIVYCGKGIEVFEGGDPSVIGNDIKYCTDCGVIVRDGGIGVFRDNTIGNHNKACVTILQNTRSTFEGNRISYGAVDGFACSGVACCPVISGNTLFCSKNNIRVVSDANPTVRENNVYDGVVGVLVTNGGRGSYSSNMIFDNESVGFVIEASARDTNLTNNKISSPMDTGAVEIDVNTDVTMRHNVIRNQFSPVFNKSLHTARARTRRTQENEEMNHLNKLDIALHDVKATFLQLQTTLSALHEPFVSRGGFEDHSKGMYKANAVSAMRLPRRGSLSSMRQQVQQVARERAQRRSGSTVSVRLSRDTPRAQSTQGTRPRSGSGGRRRKSDMPTAASGATARRRGTISGGTALPPVQVRKVKLVDSPSDGELGGNLPPPPLSPLVRRKVCFSHVPSASSGTVSIDALHCDAVDTPSSEEEFKATMSSCDLYVCFLTTPLVFSQEFADELRLMDTLDVGQLLFVNVEPDYCLGGILSDTRCRDVLRRHRLLNFRTNSDLSEVITKGILRCPQCVQLADHFPPVVYVSSCLQSLATVYSVLRHIVTSRPDLSLAFSVWPESKLGKAYNRWVRAGHQSTTHLLVFACEQYIVQNRCMKEYGAFRHLTSSILGLDETVMAAAASTSPLTTMIQEVLNEQRQDVADNPSDSNAETAHISDRRYDIGLSQKHGVFVWGTSDAAVPGRIADRVHRFVYLT
eukprot:PhM_4_TR15161/c0_g1_i1/m.15477